MYYLAEYKFRQVDVAFYRNRFTNVDLLMCKNASAFDYCGICPYTAPSGFDQIVVLERGSRYLIISWDPPAAANGILVNYTVLQAGDVIAATPPDVLQYSVSPLLPFTTYSFSVMACTSVGCVESQDIQTTTQEDGERE